MNENDFNKLCQLCRVSASKEEKAKFIKSLDDVLTYVNQLDEVDTGGVTPCFTVHKTVINVMGEDIPESPLSRDLFLANAPAHTGGMIRVPPVFNK